MIKSPRISNYPRRGHRLAPLALRDVLDQPVPSGILPGEAAGLRLCDLGASAWSYFSDEVCASLAKVIVVGVQRALGTSGIVKTLCSRPLPRPPRDVELWGLNLSLRTWNCLCKGKLTSEILSGTLTMGDVLSLRGFGGACLIDLLISLESSLPPPPPSMGSGEATLRLGTSAKAILDLPESRQVSRDDPRLGDLLQGVFPEEPCLYQVAMRLQSAKGPIAWSAEWVDAQLAEAARRIQHCLGMSLEEELSDLLRCAHLGGSALTERNHRLMVQLLGWDGHGGSTLQQVGDTEGITRERARQILRRAVNKLEGRQIFAPTLDRALSFLAEQQALPLEAVARRLAEEGFAKEPFHPRGLVRAADILGRNLTFDIRGTRRRYLAQRGVPDPVSAALRTVYGMASQRELVQVSSIRRKLPKRWRDSLSTPQLVTMLKQFGNFDWLDEPEGQLSLAAQGFKRRWLRKIKKILSVAGEMDVEDLRVCLLRAWPKRGPVPTMRTIVALCAQAPEYRVEGTRITPDPLLDWNTVLSPRERALVSVFSDRGPLLFTDTILREGGERGLNTGTVRLLLTTLPFITKVAPTLYCLAGSGPSRSRLHPSLIRARSVLLDCDQTSNNYAWFLFRVSAGMAYGNSATCHCAIRKRFRGRYHLIASDRMTSGTILVRSGAILDMREFIRGIGGVQGDFLVLALLPETGAAVASLISAEDLLADGFTCSPTRLHSLLHAAESMPLGALK
ncbi:MAG: hypothetical protein GW893_06005 [Armatimonadetes bacterium]|nr:hypothetical protein [Armatimonadota bacterium]